MSSCDTLDFEPTNPCSSRDGLLAVAEKKHFVLTLVECQAKLLAFTPSRGKKDYNKYSSDHTMIFQTYCALLVLSSMSVCSLADKVYILFSAELEVTNHNSVAV